MNIKPLNDTSTVNIITPSEQMQKIYLETTTFQKPPNEIIPNGLYRVFRFERFFDVFMMVALSMVILTMAAIIIVNTIRPDLLLTPTIKQELTINVAENTTLQPLIAIYIITGLVIFAAFAKIISVAIDFSSIKRSMEQYRNNLKNEDYSSPAYIDNLYKRLIVGQVNHNWITIHLLWFGGLFVAILFGLKNADWSIGEPGGVYLPITWNIWIKNAFIDPDLVVTLFVTILLAWIVTHIVFFLVRKKRKMDIESFFAKSQLADTETSQKWVSRTRKIWFTTFLILNLILIVIPAAYLIYQVIKKRKQISALAT
ncbi:MSC_0882 family membrane protein [Mycoplasmopsis agassizii]|uniref:Uncharacterized protein n=1 Tax=Mycoplasmopsis agassizii TaxID=33922 RepID=A0ABX4H5G2_9BACT|nr:hypothetical protein [Mycoplasmopsis agassizii]PAF55018.1 hypothetical protein CJF60_04780 [Mycoplasmopsis agassizii]SMC17528.1 hypothetical protein SAMN02745179_00483 [Mycoplasmopsis agassizii]